MAEPVEGPGGARPPVQVAGYYNGAPMPLKVDSGGALYTNSVVGSEVQLLGSDGLTLANVLSSAPGSDSGQAAIAVRIISSLAGGAGGTSSTDGASYTPTTTTGTPVVGGFDDVATATVTEGKLGIARITSYRAIHVNLRDNSGNELAVGGGTQYDEDTASTAADKLNMAGVVRKDTLATLVDADGDRTQLQVNAAGALYVAAHAVTVASAGIASGAIASGAVASGAFASGSIGSGAVASGAIASGAFASGAVGSGAIASGAVASGAVASGAFASGSIVAGAVAAGATSFVKLEDVGSADADAGVACLAVRKATPANTSGSDGDYEFLQMSAGRLWASANIDQINGVTPLMGAGNTGTGSLRVTIATDQTALTNALLVTSTGNVAHDGVDSGNPLKVGGRARTAPWTAVAADDRVDAMFDIYGKQIVRETLREDLANQQTQISSSTSETTIVTADATYKLDLYALVITNTSATGTKVTIKDDTAGTTRLVFYVPPTETRGFSVSPSGAMKQAAANKNWTATCGTSVAAVEITAMTTRSL